MSQEAAVLCVGLGTGKTLRARLSGRHGLLVTVARRCLVNVPPVVISCPTMKILILAVSTFAVAAVMAMAAESGHQGRGKRLNHVVSFKFKEGATQDQIQDVENAFRDLKSKIQEIKTFEWGTNVSPEKHDKGFSHCWILSFATEKDRDLYLNHPEHKAFGKKIGPAVADVFVVDFWAKE